MYSDVIKLRLRCCLAVPQSADTGTFPAWGGCPFFRKAAILHKRLVKIDFRAVKHRHLDNFRIIYYNNYNLTPRPRGRSSRGRRSSAEPNYVWAAKNDCRRAGRSYKPVDFRNYYVGNDTFSLPHSGAFPVTPKPLRDANLY